MRKALYILLAAYTFLLPFEKVWVLLDGVDTVWKPYRVIGLIFMLVWICWISMTRRAIRIDLYDKRFFFLFAWGTAMAGFWHIVEGNDLKYTLQSLPLMLFAFAMYTCTKNLVLERKEIEGLLNLYVAAVAVAFLAATYVENTMTGRFRAFYKNPNQAGLAAALCFAYLFAQFFFARSAKLFWQVVRAALAVGMLGVLALSGARAAIVSCGVGLAVLIWLLVRVQRRDRIRRGYRALAFVVLVLAVAFVGRDGFVDAFEKTDAAARFDPEAIQSMSGRWNIWHSAILVGIDHYGLGAGVAQYMSYHIEYVRRLEGEIEPGLERMVLGTHSDLVDLFTNYGVIGLAIFLSLAIHLFLRVWRRAFREADESYLNALAVGSCIIVYVMQLTQNSFSGPEYFLFMALIESMARLPSQRDAATGTPAPEARELLARPGQVVSA